MKRGGTSQLDPNARQQNLDLIRGMKEDLVGLLDFLEKQGIYLNDHYVDVRHLVSTLPSTQQGDEGGEP